jgi:pilus assembly protein Flp/PilA
MIPRLKKLIQRCDDEGQGLVEYGLILGLIAVVAIAALNATGGTINTLLQKVASSLSTIS